MDRLSELQKRLSVKAPAQEILAAALRLTFESVFVDLANKLDAEEMPGSTYLAAALFQRVEVPLR